MTAVSLARSLGATGSIVVNTPGGVNSNTLATIKRMAGQAVVGTLPPQTTTAVSLPYFLHYGNFCELWSILVSNYGGGASIMVGASIRDNTACPSEGGFEWFGRTPPPNSVIQEGLRCVN